MERILKRAALGVVATLLGATSVTAAPVPRAGMFCDSVQQIEELIFAIEEAGTPVESAVAAVNRKANSESACLPVQGFAEDVEMVKTVHANGKYLLIWKVRMVGIVTPLGARPIPALEQFIAVLSDKKDVNV